MNLLMIPPTPASSDLEISFIQHSDHSVLDLALLDEYLVGIFVLFVESHLVDL